MLSHHTDKFLMEGFRYETLAFSQAKKGLPTLQDCRKEFERCLRETSTLLEAETKRSSRQHQRHASHGIHKNRQNAANSDFSKQEDSGTLLYIHGEIDRVRVCSKKIDCLKLKVQVQLLYYWLTRSVRLSKLREYCRIKPKD